LSPYTVYVTPAAWREIKDLPGHMRQRVRRAVDPLASKALHLPDLDYDVWRLQPDKWRIVYAIGEAAKAVDVLAARKRPPYDYGDLGRLLARV